MIDEMGSVLFFFFWFGSLIVGMKFIFDILILMMAIEFLLQAVGPTRIRRSALLTTST